MNTEETARYVKRAQAGDLEAFNWIVRRFQTMAVGYAASILGDPQSSQDAAQDSFVEAYLTLAGLRSPGAFLSWFRKIIFKHCDRQTRKRQVETVPIEAAELVKSPMPGLDALVEQQEAEAALREAIQSLPPAQREVVSLFYWGEHAQQDIAEFLGLSLTTVKSRLHQGRSQLRKRLVTMENTGIQGEPSSSDEAFVARVNEQIALASAYIATHADEGKSTYYTNPHPVYQLWSSLLVWAIEAKADAIRLAPKDEQVVVQFRNGGVFQPMMSYPKSLHPAIVLRFQVAADIEDLEKPGPWNGSFPIGYHSEGFEAGVSYEPDNQDIDLTVVMVSVMVPK